MEDEPRSRFETPRGRVTGGSPSMQGIVFSRSMPRHFAVKKNTAVLHNTYYIIQAYHNVDVYV